MLKQAQLEETSEEVGWSSAAADAILKHDQPVECILPVLGPPHSADPVSASRIVETDPGRKGVCTGAVHQPHAHLTLQSQQSGRPGILPG